MHGTRKILESLTSTFADGEHPGTKFVRSTYRSHGFGQCHCPVEYSADSDASETLAVVDLLEVQNGPKENLMAPAAGAPDAAGAAADDATGGCVRRRTESQHSSRTLQEEKLSNLQVVDDAAQAGHFALMLDPSRPNREMGTVKITCRYARTRNPTLSWVARKLSRICSY